LLQQALHQAGVSVGSRLILNQLRKSIFCGLKVPLAEEKASLTVGPGGSRWLRLGPWRKKKEREKQPGSAHSQRTHANRILAILSRQKKLFVWALN
jgi:hypothetical protein